MEYLDFYDIAVYRNGECRGKFTQREIAANAYEYLCEFEDSKAKKRLNSTMLDLVDLLMQDEGDECVEWATRILTEING